jgi:hypothetical protein
MPKKPTTFSMRMPEDINDRIQSYAAEHECTKAEAMSHFARAGIELEDNGVPEVGAEVDLFDLSKRLDAIEIEVRKTSSAAGSAHDAAVALKDDLAALSTKNETTAIVPADIKGKIQEYSAAHGCSDEESLQYYARIGVEMSAQNHPVTMTELEELSRKLDAVAADGAAKNEQLKALAASIAKIEANTTPETVEVEGELADPAIEEAKDALEEERREAERDERTRKIINEAMESYIEKSKPQQSQPQAPQSNVLLPVLASAVVALVIGLVILLIAKG